MPSDFLTEQCSVFQACNKMLYFQVAQLVYEAYETMANKSMKKVCVEVRKQWPDVENIAIYHR